MKNKKEKKEGLEARLRRLAPLIDAIHKEQLEGVDVSPNDININKHKSQQNYRGDSLLDD